MRSDYIIILDFYFCSLSFPSCKHLVDLLRRGTAHFCTDNITALSNGDFLVRTKLYEDKNRRLNVLLGHDENTC